VPALCAATKDLAISGLTPSPPLTAGDSHSVAIDQSSEAFRRFAVFGKSEPTSGREPEGEEAAELASGADFLL
jgi:hypothetical protein